MDILYAEIEERKKYNYGFLLIPRYVVNNRELINIVKLEYFFQLQRNKSKRI